MKKNSGFFYWLGMLFLGMSSHGKDVKKQLIKNPKDFTLKKANAFVSSIEIEQNGIHLAKDDILPFAEQIIYRTVECSQCLKNSSCPYCECEFPIKMLTPEQFCPNGEWSELKSGEDWSKYKKEQNIKFKVEHG